MGQCASTQTQVPEPVLEEYGSHKKVFNGLDLDGTVIHDHAETQRRAVNAVLQERCHHLHTYEGSKNDDLPDADKEYWYRERIQRFNDRDNAGEKSILYLENADIYKCSTRLFHEIKKHYEEVMRDLIKRNLSEHSYKPEEWFIRLEEIDPENNRRLNPICNTHPEIMNDDGSIYFVALCVEARNNARKLVNQIHQSPDIHLFFWTKGGYNKKRAVVEWLLGGAQEYDKYWIANRIFYGYDCQLEDRSKRYVKHFGHVPYYRSELYGRDRSQNLTIRQLMGAEQPEQDPIPVCFVDDVIKCVYGVDQKIEIEEFEGGGREDNAISRLVKKLNEFNKRSLTEAVYKMNEIDLDKKPSAEPVVPEIDRRRMIEYIDSIINQSSISSV